MAGWVNLLFFAFFTARALRRRSGLRPRRRNRIILNGVIGIALSTLLLFSEWETGIKVLSYIKDWLPAPLMLLAYWQAGGFYTQPNTFFQSRLEAFDAALFGRLPRRRFGRRSANLILSYLEFTYFFCYLLIPLGVVVLYLGGMRSRVGAYWLVVLPPAYLCYATTAFLQTLPPRSLRREDDNPAPENTIRRLNLWIVRHASIRINTFPSAHVAATVAASLGLWSASPFAAAIFLWISLSIAIATVACRYHYAADALAGAALAALSFLVHALLT